MTAFVAYVLRFAFVAYLCAIVFLFVFQRKLLYFPVPAKVAAAPSSDDLEVVSLVLQGETFSGRVINPGQAHALIYFGGNAEDVYSQISLFKALYQNVSVYLLPYRGFNGNPGTPTQGALCRDALALSDHVKQAHEHVSVMGRSLGSAVAAYVVSQRSFVENAILVTPFDSIANIAQERYWMFPVKWLIRDSYTSLAFLRSSSHETQFLVVQAAQDEIVSSTRTQALVASLPKERLQHIVIQGVDHNSVTDSAVFFDALKKQF